MPRIALRSVDAMLCVQKFIAGTVPTLILMILIGFTEFRDSNTHQYSAAAQVAALR